METPQNTPPQDSPVSNHLVDDDEINLLELLLVLVKNKFMIIGSMAATFVLAAGVTLLMPNIYTSTARLLPPQQERGGLGAMMAGMGDLAALAGISAGGSSGELFVGMLQSRTVADAVIDQFDLMTVYDQKYRTEMYGKLNKLVNVSLGRRDGIITVSVDDEDPVRAAAIANAYVEELKKLNVRLNLSNAGRERVFLEERLAVVQADLARAEDNLREFQETNKAIKLDTQASAIIEAISRLRGELASKEVELGVLLTFQTEQNPEVRSLREGIAQLKSQLRRLEESPAGSKISADIFIATSNVPDLGIQYARFLRDFKVQETLFELLTKQYEVAKINEAKNTSALQVLDEGAVPDKKSKPKRAMIVLLATFAVGFCAVLFAFVREYGQRMDEEDRQRWGEIRGMLRWRGKALTSVNDR
ncbi:GumC family protein [Geoalkalibacter sp.]|uniref:GumC family protein n=1 Tax=Geoalkalibacter sp. TaxID=3041440 RepID=UPI00272E3916|nr:Wzz/FepE/Etk N-terminal domain-containing protein [Geoalkalibacter sp.]